MPLFRGSKNATIVNGEIVATAQDIADAVNDAIAAKNAAENAEQGAIDNLDQFDDRYLGAKSSDPSVDNDGDPLVDGALYYNTTETATKVYDSDSDTWINLKLSDQDQANIDTVANISTEVETVGNNISDVQDVATNLSGSDTIGTVASSINNVDAVGGSIADVETVSTNLSGPDTIGIVAGSISDVQTVSTNIADVNTAADNIIAIQNAPQFASDAEDAQGYAEEWAITAEDTPVSVDAGGDGSTDFSALHHAAKASASASAASTSESNALTSEQNAATSESNALTSEQNAANSEQAASGSAQAAATSESNALTSENNAATSENNALDSANDAQTAEAGAVDAQSYAEEWANAPEDTLISSDAGGDQTDDFSALHHANKAAASASAASTSEDNAAISESNALTSEQNASNSASAALTSEQNASQSESNAATSEQNAQQAATDAETALDNFTDQYLGPKSSEPTTDNDGDPLVTGALYYNTTDDQLEIWNGTQWDPAAFSASGTVTSFNGRDGVVELQSGDVTDALGFTPEDSATAYDSSEFATDFASETTDNLSEGTNNLYYTDTRARNALAASGDISYDSATGTFSYTERTDSEIRGLFSASGDLNYDSATGVFSVTVPAGYDSSDFDTDFSGKSTDDLSEGTSNLYYTDTRARNALSASGALNYDSATGTFSYTERTDQDIRNLFSAGGDLNYNSSTGEFSVTAGADLSTSTTDDLAEGNNNLYYTDARVDSRIGDGTLTISTGSGLTGSGTFDANQSTNNTVTVSHANTSSATSSNNSGSTFIQDVFIDSFGHVTGFNTAEAGGGSVDSNDLPSGTVLQMQSVQLDNVFVQSTSGANYTIINEFDLNFTPQRADSTILIQVSSFLEFHDDGQVHDHTFDLFRDTTRLGHPTDGSRNTGIAMATRSFSGSDDSTTPEHLSFTFVDQPNTFGTVTYRLACQTEISTAITFNACVDHSTKDQIIREKGVSTITAMEIAG